MSSSRFQKNQKKRKKKQEVEREGDENIKEEIMLWFGKLFLKQSKRRRQFKVTSY